MKSNKALSCLVTLLLCGYPFNTTVADGERTWEDSQGRRIEARLLQADPSKDTIEIERTDGVRLMLPIASLSQADQQFIQKWHPEVELNAAAMPSSSESLAELSPDQWEWLAHAGLMTNYRYVNAPVKKLVEMINKRITNVNSPNLKEAIKGVRIDEDAELTKINAEFEKTVNFSTFLNVLAEQNSLQLRVDASGFIVLQRMTTPAPKIVSPEKIEEAKKIEEADSVRTWTDVQGRSIEARLLQTDPSKATIEIERADGVHFTLPIARLSQVDQQFIQKWQPEVDGTAAAMPTPDEPSVAVMPSSDKPSAEALSSSSKPSDEALPSSSESLAELSKAQWEWLAQAGSMTARKYVNAPAQQLVALLNTRLNGANSTNMKESIKGVRIDENAELTEINVVFDNTVSYSTFFKAMSEQNSLQLRVDASGFIVLQRVPTSSGKIKFLGT